MTSGDDPAANGRCEVEVGQLKRRLRLMLHESEVDAALWPCAARHAAEERFRLQVQRLGLSMNEANAEVWCSSSGEGEKMASPGPTFVQSFQVDAASWSITFYVNWMDHQG